MGLLTMLMMSFGVNKILTSDNSGAMLLKIIWSLVAMVGTLAYIVFGGIYLDTVTFIGIPVIILTVIALIKHNTDESNS